MKIKPKYKVSPKSKIEPVPKNHPSRRAELVRRILLRTVTTKDGCWLWQGPTSGSKESTRGHGYGRMSLHGQTCAVHRVMWVNKFGYIPSSTQLDHLCSNRLCCNPSHLEAVTHKQNQKRRDQRLKKES